MTTPAPSDTPASPLFCCPDWPAQIVKLNAPIVLQSARSGFKWQYDGIKFRFCPWCGKERPKP